jgi:hypothetical protein
MASLEAQGHQLVLVKRTFVDKELLSYFAFNEDNLECRASDANPAMGPRYYTIGRENGRLGSLKRL